LEWDYRHEIEHLNRYPRREGILFKHYFKARRILMEKHEYSELELFKKYFKQIANITYDSYIDYELAQKYPKVKCEIEHYIRNLPAEALTIHMKKLGSMLLMVLNLNGLKVTFPEPWCTFMRESRAY